MRKIFIFLALLMPLLANAQEKWDATNKIYTNTAYHFHWALRSDYNWTKDPPLAAHTVFKAISNPNITLLVNIRSLAGGAISPYMNLDAWESFDVLKEAEKMSTYSGETLISFTKCKLAGKNAIKSIKRIHSPRNQTAYDYLTKYIFYIGTNMWQLSLECPSDFYNKNGESGIDKFFSGFGLD